MEINPHGEVLLEVNTRYQKLADLLLNEGFKIRKSVNRMLLKGFEVTISTKVLILL